MDFTRNTKKLYLLTSAQRKWGKKEVKIRSKDSAFCSLWAAGGAEGGPPTPSGFQLLFLSSTRAQRATLTRSLQALPWFPPPGLPFESNQWRHPHPAGRPGSICKTKIEDPPFKSYPAGRPHTPDSHQYSTAKTKWTKKQRVTSPVPGLRVHSHSRSCKRPRWGRLETKHLVWFRGHSSAQAMQPRGWDMGSAGTAHLGQGHQSAPGAAWSAWSTSVSRTTCHCGLLKPTETNEWKSWLEAGLDPKPRRGAPAPVIQETVSKAEGERQVAGGPGRGLLAVPEPEGKSISSRQALLPRAALKLSRTQVGVPLLWAQHATPVWRQD